MIRRIGKRGAYPLKGVPADDVKDLCGILVESVGAAIVVSLPKGCYEVCWRTPHSIRTIEF